MKPQVLEVLRELVAFRSLTPHHAGSFDYIESYARQLGGRIVAIDRNQTSNRLISFGSGSTIFAYAGHVDVVPVGDISRWQSQDPFTLLQDGDNLIGRGVADMKGAIAAFLVALRDFIATRDPQSYQIVLVLTSDEEGSAVDGTRIVVEYLKQQQIRFNYCLVGEPSCVSQLGDTIKVGRRGSLTGELIITGKQGHIAYPHLCENPIHNFAPALLELSSTQWDQGNRYFPPTSLQFANLNAGLGVTNVIPGKLSTNFNFRYNTEHSVASLEAKVNAILQRHQLNYSLSWQHSAAPFMTAAGNFIPLLEQAINAVCQITPTSKTDGGTSDGRFLVAVSDEIAEFGLRNASIHQINESIALSELQQLTLIYNNILSKVFHE